MMLHIRLLEIAELNKGVLNVAANCPAPAGNG